MSVKTYQRKKLWWMEEGEVLPSDRRLKEEYSSNRLKAGNNGLDADLVTDNYSSEGDASFDKLGATSANKNKPKSEKGIASDVKKERARKPARKVVREDEGFEDENFTPDEEDVDVNVDLGQEDDIPPGFEDDTLEGGEPSEDGECEPEDIQITIKGKLYNLVPAETEEFDGGEKGEGEFDPEGSADEMGGESDEGGEGYDNTDEDINAEDEDITHPVESRKKKLSPRQAALRDAQIKKYVKLQKTAKKALKELFTGSYVLNNQGEVGLDFSPVKGDTSFAIVDRAASGRQYTPTKNTNDKYEPDPSTNATQSKNPSRQVVDGDVLTTVSKTAITKEKANKAKAFQKWLAYQESLLNEEAEAQDAGHDAEHFNLTDAEDNYIGDNLANMPLLVGADTDALETYKTVKEKRKVRRESDQSVQFPDEEKDDDDSEGMQESFDFRKALKGDYSKVRG